MKGQVGLRYADAGKLVEQRQRLVIQTAVLLQARVQYLLVQSFQSGGVILTGNRIVRELNGDPLLFTERVIRGKAGDGGQPHLDGGPRPVISGQAQPAGIVILTQERGRGELSIPANIIAQPVELLVFHVPGVRFQQLYFSRVDFQCKYVHHSSSLAPICECFFFQSSNPSANVHWPIGAP